MSLMVVGLVLFVPMWLDAVRIMALDLSSQSWAFMRGTVIGGAIVVGAALFAIVRVWIQLIQRLAQTDWNSWQH